MGCETMTSYEQNIGSVWGKIVAQSWSDAEYKSRVISDPRQALEEEGLSVPEDIAIEVSDGGPARVHLVIPEKPDGTDIAVDEETLEGIAGGSHCCCTAPPGTNWW